MPVRQLIPFIDALPHVRAIASFRSAEATAVGSGTMKEGARRAAAGRWKKDLRSRGPRRIRGAAAMAAAAAGAGIGFVRVPAKPSAPDATSTEGGLQPSTTA